VQPTMVEVMRCVRASQALLPVLRQNAPHEVPVITYSVLGELEEYYKMHALRDPSLIEGEEARSA
jgi:hypothetical protein